jgi:hypothetical protein
MKKIITLLLAAGAFITVHAQTSKDESRKVILGQPKNGNGDNGTTSRQGRDVILGGGNDDGRNSPTYPGSTSSKQARIDQVNREYDAKIYSIRTNSTLSQAEKDRIIRDLEKERARKIKQVNGDDRGRSNNKDKKYKSNNGKHKGWEKGKGNKHRDRDDDQGRDD